MNFIKKYTTSLMMIIVSCAAVSQVSASGVLYLRDTSSLEKAQFPKIEKNNDEHLGLLATHIRLREHAERTEEIVKYLVRAKWETLTISKIKKINKQLEINSDEIEKIVND
tara:strand:- start:1238 stop:1570 length:333 start_codon:yes stop_codon:yes gene_type:complete